VNELIATPFDYPYDYYYINPSFLEIQPISSNPHIEAGDPNDSQNKKKEVKKAAVQSATQARQSWNHDVFVIVEDAKERKLLGLLLRLFANTAVWKLASSKMPALKKKSDSRLL
jgi:hypothetical protein